MANRTPNQDLERLFRETGWTLRQFAQAVNRVGTECGTPVAYTPQTVHAWLKGHVPHEERRVLILEALARRLHRPITHADAGLAVPQDQPGSGPGINMVEELAALGRSDMDPSRRSMLGASLFSVALTVPGWPEVAGRLESIPTGKTHRIGIADVELITDVTKRFSELDDERGGRIARPSAASFLVNVLTPHLKAQASDTVRKRMLAAASELCYLIGYMAVDEGLHGTAQRYYVKALELAGAADDQSGYCLTLHGMSSQAANLGHGPSALRLADAAAGAAPDASPNMRAHLASQQAFAAAVAGDRSSVNTHLRRTEKAMSHAEPEVGKVVVGHFSAPTLTRFVAQVKYGLGETSGSIDPMREYVASLTGDHRRRRRVLETAKLAYRQCEIGHLEEACATWDACLDDYPRVRSGRCDDQIRDMFSMVRPHLKNQAARELHERARTVVPASLVG
ncbi:tetratricopeptide repeat protein [Streptomyces sp. NPDC005962]|uniref:tetratricopeptide repeat protein n=1 Tax=Streptomyces sp. NPDC005962 TaxID=3154466 RepID=UPI00340CE090